MVKKVFILSLATGMLLSAAIFAQDEEELKPIVSVNGTIIYTIDVERELNYMYQQSLSLDQEFETSKVDDYRLMIIKQLISRELIYQEALKKGYKKNEKATDEYISSLKKSYGTEEAFLKALEKQRLNLDELRAMNNKYGIINDFIDKELRSKIKIEAGSAREYYDENTDEFKESDTVHAFHILIKVPKNASDSEYESAYDKIMEIRKQIVNGKDFSEMAKKYSEDPGSKNDGDLGTFTKGQMVPEFDAAAFSLEVGSLSQPVKTQFGYHLILVKEKTIGKIIPFEDVKEKIENYLTNMALDQVAAKFVAKLMEETDIEFF